MYKQVVSGDGEEKGGEIIWNIGAITVDAMPVATTMEREWEIFSCWTILKAQQGQWKQLWEPLSRDDDSSLRKEWISSSDRPARKAGQ
jgi:hypothetical protein